MRAQMREWAWLKRAHLGPWQGKEVPRAAKYLVRGRTDNKSNKKIKQVSKGSAINARGENGKCIRGANCENTPDLDSQEF